MVENDNSFCKIVRFHIINQQCSKRIWSLYWKLMLIIEIILTIIGILFFKDKYDIIYCDLMEFLCISIIIGVYPLWNWQLIQWTVKSPQKIETLFSQFMICLGLDMKLWEICQKIRKSPSYIRWLHHIVKEVHDINPEWFYFSKKIK